MAGSRCSFNSRIMPFEAIQYVPVKRHIRIYGAPADDSGVTEKVTFTAN